MKKDSRKRIATRRNDTRNRHIKEKYNFFEKVSLQYGNGNNGKVTPADFLGRYNKEINTMKQQHKQELQNFEEVTHEE